MGEVTEFRNPDHPWPGKPEVPERVIQEFDPEASDPEASDPGESDPEDLEVDDDEVTDQAVDEQNTLMRPTKPVLPNKEGRIQQTMEESWIGDAVLCLHARSKILEDGGIDSEKFVRMTSNRFLGTVGEASEVEAEIGRVYRSQGLAAAFQWIETHLSPQFEKQEMNRLKREGG